MLGIAPLGQTPLGAVPTGAETILAPKWHAPLAEPVRQKIVPALAVALIASGATVPPIAPFPETVQESKWHQPWSEPVRVKPQLPATEQHYFELEPAPSPFVATGWYAPLSEPVRIRPRLPEPAQQFFSAQPWPDVSIAWWQRLAEPVRARPALPAGEQQFLPGSNFHLIIRVMQDRCLVDGGNLYAASQGFAQADTKEIDLPARSPRRPARTAMLNLSFGQIALQRPKSPAYRHLPKSVSLTLVEVTESGCPNGVEPIHWRLLTTHDVPDAAAAWRIIDWYKQRWTIEQLFRLMKTQGLRLEDSQLETADRLIKLAAIAAKAAAITLQLLQARDGQSTESASAIFPEGEIAVLDALNTRIEGKTALQKNPHTKHSLAWASWIIARLGGWDGYPSSKPPGPITFRHGLEHFRVILIGWGLRDVCMP